MFRVVSLEQLDERNLLGRLAVVFALLAVQFSCLLQIRSCGSVGESCDKRNKSSWGSLALKKRHLFFFSCSPTGCGYSVVHFIIPGPSTFTVKMFCFLEQLELFSFF